MDKQNYKIDNYKDVKLSEFYKNDVLNRALLRTKKAKKDFFILPNLDFIYGATALLAIIILFSSINIKENNFSFKAEFLSAEINNEIPYEFIKTISSNSNYELSDYYKNLSEEDILDVFEEMDDLFNNNSSYLIENLAGNTDF